MDTIRVWYCWTIVNLILSLVAANTYESPWQTDSLKALSNAGLLFFTWTTYAFLAVGTIAWYGNCKLSMKGRNCKSCCCALKNGLIDNNFKFIIYAGLIIALHAVVIITIQAVFFFSDHGSLIQLRIGLSVVCFVVSLLILPAGVCIATLTKRWCINTKQ